MRHELLQYKVTLVLKMLCKIKIFLPKLQKFLPLENYWKLFLYLREEIIQIQILKYISKCDIYLNTSSKEKIWKEFFWGEKQTSTKRT